MHISIGLEEQSRRKPTPADTYLFRTEIREVQPLSLVRHVSGTQEQPSRRAHVRETVVYLWLCVACAPGLTRLLPRVVNDF